MVSTSQKTLLIISAAAIIVLLLIFRADKKALVRADSANVVVMNTIAKIIAVAPDEQTAQIAIEATLKKIRHLENLFNRYDPNSQLSFINRQADKEPVKIDKELLAVLQQSIYYSKLTDGAFDITVGPLVDLWKKCAEANSMPTDEQLAEVKKRIGYDKLLLDANQFTVRFAAEAVSLDLGAIAKGFAADRAIEEMKKSGALGGLVDLGGQIGCFGLTEKKGEWVIGVQNPSKLEDNQTIIKLALSDLAAATSGDYRRHYKIGNKQFSHIFNPATEKSTDALLSVTIITPSGTAADALATAVSVLGTERGIELIEKLQNTEAIIIRAENGEILKTSGAKRYILR
jgi:thiamine biosynthesis lipoprotein